jgi:hypothetical protein
VLLAACGNTSPRVLLLQPLDAPGGIQQACQLAEVRCSSCHTLERITNAPHRTEREWAWQVEKMRLMPASGISEADANVILKCLIYRDPPTSVDSKILSADAGTNP